MKSSRLLFALAGGWLLPLSVSAAGPVSEPLPPPGYDVTPLEQAYQEQQMTRRQMPAGAEGSAGVSIFDRLDSNKDGFLSTEEADQSPMAKRDFGTLDKDGDARISHEEWKTGGGM